MLHTVQHLVRAEQHMYYAMSDVEQSLIGAALGTPTSALGYRNACLGPAVNWLGLTPLSS